MKLTTLTDRDLMRHWDVAARFAFSPISTEEAKPYLSRMAAIGDELKRRDEEREQYLSEDERRELRRKRLKAARSAKMARKTRKRPRRPKFPKMGSSG